MNKCSCKFYKILWTLYSYFDTTIEYRIMLKSDSSACASLQTVDVSSSASEDTVSEKTFVLSNYLF